MEITIQDIKKEYLDRFGDSSSSRASKDVDVVKLANQLRLAGKSNTSDDLPIMYINMIKEANIRARKRMGLGERLSLR